MQVWSRSDYLQVSARVRSNPNSELKAAPDATPRFNVRLRGASVSKRRSVPAFHLSPPTHKHNYIRRADRHVGDLSPSFLARAGPH